VASVILSEAPALRSAATNGLVLRSGSDEREGSAFRFAWLGSIPDERVKGTQISQIAQISQKQPKSGNAFFKRS
jgi:hypothetical protein